MPSIKGTIKNGLVYPSVAIADQKGKSVLITIIEPNPNIPSTDETSWNSEDWDQFDQLIEKCTIDTGIIDLAHQHDHYIHGTPKRESYPSLEILRDRKKNLFKYPPPSQMNYQEIEDIFKKEINQK